LNLLTVVFSIGFFVLATLTFFVWLQPPPAKARAKTFGVEAYTILAAVTAVLFFLACFALGVWFAILRMRGGLWGR
jgi:Co/Zn/Cd efflux system component